jgi:hypothetical protein
MFEEPPKAIEFEDMAQAVSLDFGEGFLLNCNHLS